MDYTGLYMKNISHYKKNILLILYSLIIVLSVISRSQLFREYDVNNLRLIAIFLMTAYSIIFIDHSMFQWIWFILGLFISITGIVTEQVSIEYLVIIFLMFSLSEIYPRKFLQYTMFTIGVVLLILMLLTFLKVIPNVKVGITSIRNSLGTNYPVIFSGYVFYMSAAFVALYNKRNIIIPSIFLFIVVLFLDKFTAARNDEICILLLIVVLWIKNMHLVIQKNIVKISGIIIFLAVISSMFISVVLPYSTNLYGYLNQLLTNRLQLQYTLFIYYRPTLFGQKIYETGLMGLGRPGYFYIDNSYIKLLFMGGLLLFLLLFITFFFQVFKLYRNHVYIMSLILLIILLNGIIEDSLIRPSINLLVPLFCVNVHNFKNNFNKRLI